MMYHWIWLTKKKKKKDQQFWRYGSNSHIWVCKPSLWPCPWRLQKNLARHLGQRWWTTILSLVTVLHIFWSTLNDKVSWRPNFNRTVSWWCKNNTSDLQKTKSVVPGTAATEWFLITKLLLVLLSRPTKEDVLWLCTKYTWPLTPAKTKCPWSPMWLSTCCCSVLTWDFNLAGKQ